MNLYKLASPLLGLALVTSLSAFFSCKAPAPASDADSPSMTREEMVEHGKYLVMVGGCNDCHTPKKMGSMGPEPDMGLALSGHPQDLPIPEVVPEALGPGKWVLMNEHLTAAVGPWGVSYSANITSDSATGIGTWTEEMFVNAMRTGKHMGNPGGRPILPPMPWQTLNMLSDEDLKCILAYLKTTTPIKNAPPGPVPLEELLSTSDGE